MPTTARAMGTGTVTSVARNKIAAATSISTPPNRRYLSIINSSCHTLSAAYGASRTGGRVSVQSASPSVRHGPSPPVARLRRVPPRGRRGRRARQQRSAATLRNRPSATAVPSSLAHLLEALVGHQQDRAGSRQRLAGYPVPVSVQAVQVTGSQRQAVVKAGLRLRLGGEASAMVEVGAAVTLRRLPATWPPGSHHGWTLTNQRTTALQSAPAGVGRLSWQILLLERAIDGVACDGETQSLVQPSANLPA